MTETFSQGLHDKWKEVFTEQDIKRHIRKSLNPSNRNFQYSLDIKFRL